MKLNAILFSFTVIITCHVTYINAVRILPAKRSITQLIASAFHRTKISPCVAAAFARHKYAATGVFAATVFCAIPKTRRMLLSNIQRHKPLFASAYTRLRRLTKVTGRILLTVWYKLTTLFGLTINIRDEHNNTMLYDAIRKNKTEKAISLIYAGANPNLLDFKYIEYPLQCAAYHENIEIVNALLAHHANPNFSATGRYTPLHIATSGGGPRLCELSLMLTPIQMHKIMTRQLLYI